MKARDLMTSDPFTVVPSDPVSRAAQLMRDLGVGCVPVVGDVVNRRLVGMITDRDIAVRCVASGHPSGCAVADHMSGLPLQTVSPDADQREIVEKMELAQVRRIPVVGSENRLIGIIAQADIAMRLGPIEPDVVEEVLQAVSRPLTAVHTLST
jgi:CBS domain-containing protein